MSVEPEQPRKSIEQIRKEFEEAQQDVLSEHPLEKPRLSLPARIFLRIAQADHKHGKSLDVLNNKVQDGEFD